MPFLKKKKKTEKRVLHTWHLFLSTAAGASKKLYFVLMQSRHYQPFGNEKWDYKVGTMLSWLYISCLSFFLSVSHALDCASLVSARNTLPTHKNRSPFLPLNFSSCYVIYAFSFIVFHLVLPFSPSLITNHPVYMRTKLCKKSAIKNSLTASSHHHKRIVSLSKMYAETSCCSHETKTYPWCLIVFQDS